MVSKLIASGEVLNEGGKVIVASVYNKFDETGKESTTAGDKYVVLKMSQKDADAMPTDAITYASIFGSSIANEDSGDAEETAAAKKSKAKAAPKAAGANVPGFDGHAAVALAAPVKLVYSRAKAFVDVNGKNQVYAQLRYYF